MCSKKRKNASTKPKLTDGGGGVLVAAAVEDGVSFVFHLIF